MTSVDTQHNDAEQALRYNADVYKTYYQNPLLMLRYDLLYREQRISRLLQGVGIDVARPGFAAFEYGFGAGHLLRVMARASKVVGMESSPSAVVRAQSQKPQGHPCWEMSEWGDAAKIPAASASFDLVSASHVLEHLEDDDAALDEWLRLVKPGGHLLVLLPSNEVLFSGSKHLRTYDKDHFSARLRARGLKEVAVDEHQRFDRPFKDRRMVLFSRKGFVPKMLVDAPKTLLFLPAQLLSFRLLQGLDSVLGSAGAKSSSIAYLFQKAA